jgi:glyoxylase-like metal-dependent hydrolase (beta-lactamase superfamily II)
VSLEEIVDGVWGIPMGYVNAFVVRAEGGLTLVDSGLSGKLGAVRSALTSAGGALTDVAITHHHMDHTGTLAALVKESGAAVWAHPVDAPVIRGEVPAPRPPGRTAIDRMLIPVVMRFGPKAPPARVDHEVSHGEELPIAGGLRAYHTPGHTMGHLSYLLEAKRVLFVGDAAANNLGRLGPPFGLFTEDHAEIVPSIAVLAGLVFDVACFGHGRVLKGEACAKFRALAEKLAR